jgi:hypothetical protein
MVMYSNTNYFINWLNKGMELMQRVGHITDYEDFTDEDNNNGIEAFLRLNEVINCKSKAQWVENGVSLAELEKCRHFLDWQKKLDPDWEDYE